MLLQSQFVSIFLHFIELWYYNAKHFWTIRDYIVKSGSFLIQCTCSVYIIQKILANLVVFKALPYLFLNWILIKIESVRVLYIVSFYYQITFWYQITFYDQITFWIKYRYIIAGCGFNVSNTNPTICINDIIKLYNKEHNSSLPILTKEKLLARTVNLIEEFIKDFQLNGRTGFCKKYYQRWLHG